MNKKGFTLVELLAVITIIGILSLIAVPTIEKITKDNKEKIYQTQLNNIILSLKNWASENKEYLPNKEGEELTLTLGSLKSDGYIEYELKNPKNNKCFDNSMELKIIKIKENFDYSIELDTIKEADSCGIDDSIPIIILNGSSVEKVEINSVYIDKGVRAKDHNDNDITDRVIKTISGEYGVVETNHLGNNYVITYSVTLNGKTAKTSRTVKIVDTTAPIINIPSNLSISKSIASLDVMKGVSATDNSGEQITVSSVNNIVFGLPGKYTITYTAIDSSGNKTVLNRIITIENIT